ncbi:polypeptide N-acetylgalactosaminyltransferase 5-like isoform X1 [Haliotis rufescens]|uniref:polypeptide N-acetylgalactosaminyltransferase 5-like isoform X1 n=1 Tax=Haliotis rufescens TaxID=6454 RepID=UPI00201F45A3|nr:polypeptide N-acetylgalactosaminyltransferase 5-like isoform X1 [Haliotis rufescens]
MKRQLRASPKTVFICFLLVSLYAAGTFLKNALLTFHDEIFYRGGVKRRYDNDDVLHHIGDTQQTDVQTYIHTAAIDGQKDVHTAVRDSQKDVHTAVRDIRKDVHTTVTDSQKDEHTAVRDSQKDVNTAVRDIRKDVHSGKALEQPVQHTQNTQSVEYYVEEYGGEDSNVTYPPFVEHSPENGPGEWGVEYRYSPKEEEILQWTEGRRRNRFNQMVSDRISVHRRLPDSRLDECKSRVYPVDLPPASVIICFHNEAWSTLLRSVHSVLDRSPSHLVREIILVDDASTQEHLMSPLKKYMSKLGKVKIVRLRKHQGLIRARLAGYDVATSPILVFLDSHIECYPGWLEPLLDRIQRNPKTVPIPMIDVIHSEHFGTGILNTTKRLGVFRWKQLKFHWEHVSKDRRNTLKTPTEPIRSPTMIGGLFAIDKHWFTTLGTYDPGLLYWGAENMELSFKIWMCNGTLEVLPCSHVAHVFRNVNPIKWHRGGKPSLTNSIRVAEVWLDEYKHYFYEANRLSPGIDYGDVTDRRKLRDSLHCHDFRWYIENIYPECPIAKVLNTGEIRSVSRPTHCLAGGNKKPTILRPCQQAADNQYWQLFPTGVLLVSASRRMCVTTPGHNDCIANATDNWTYTEAKTLYLKPSDKCLTVAENSTLVMTRCDGGANQRWNFAKSKFQIHGT